MKINLVETRWNGMRKIIDVYFCCRIMRRGVGIGGINQQLLEKVREFVEKMMGRRGVFLEKI